MPIMKINLNGCRRNLGGCNRKPTLSGTVTIMGNTYNTDDIAWQGNYSFDENGNMFADSNGAYWWATTPNGESFMTDGQSILYAVDAYGTHSVSNSFDWAGLGKSISNVISSGANAYNSIANSETSKQIQNILKNSGLVSQNQKTSSPVVFGSTNYTPYILGLFGVLGLYLILRKKA